MLRILLVSFLFFPAYLCAEDAYPRAEVQMGAFTAFGQAQEYVFVDAGSSTLLSRLLWPLVPVVGPSLDLKVVWNDWLDSRVQFRAGFPLVTGTMTDEDWNVPTSGPTIDYSRSDTIASSTSFYQARAEAGFPSILENLSLTPSVGFTYLLSSWEAWGPGVQNQILSNGTTDTKYLQGMVISLRENWYIPYLGLQYHGENGPWHWSTAVRFSPYLFCTDTDDHAISTGSSGIYTGVVFRDYYWGGFWLEPEVNLGWNLGAWGNLEASASFSWAYGLRGDTYQDGGIASSNPNQPNTSLFSNTAGVGYYLASLFLGWSKAF